MCLKWTRMKGCIAEELGHGVFAQRIQCLVGMEACDGAHEWARRLKTLRCIVKLMAPELVRPYMQTNKNAADAESIYEAMS